jgi:hypothetical protein
MGSDHQVFVQAGIVATNIAISGIKSHRAASPQIREKGLCA